MKNNPGFTLIEILVVIVIVGITLGFALLVFGDFGRQRSIMTSAEHFASYINFIQQEAIMESTTLGIDVHPTYYSVLRFTQNSWQNIPGHGIFKQQSFPNRASVQFKDPINTSPQIIINASGEVTPFTLLFKSANDISIATVQTNAVGAITVEPIHAS